jgi:hypothetical protein
MKHLTYKSFKSDDSSHIAEFDKEHHIKELKKEIGLPEIPYEELHNYKVQLNSPTGRSSKFEVNAKDYIDNELKAIEDGINEFNENPVDNLLVNFDVHTITIKDEDLNRLAEIKAEIESDPNFWEWCEGATSLQEVKMGQPIEDFRYFDVSIPDLSGSDIHYTVVLFNNKSQTVLDQLNTIKRHPYTVKERQRDFLTGTEFIINYYQWVNIVSNLDIPRQDNHISYEDIASRMDTIFENVPGIDLPEDFI